MTVRPFDFREIAALDDTASAIRAWLSKSTSFFSDEWDQATGFGAKLALGSVSTDAFETVLEKSPRTDLCCVANVRDDLSTVWIGDAGQFRKLVGDLMGMDTPDEEGELSEGDPELGKIEMDLAQWVLDTIASSLSRGWMGTDDLEVTTSPLEKDPRKLRLFRGKDLVTCVSLEVECKSSTAAFRWLLPKQKLSMLFDETVDKRRKASAASPPKELIAQMPVDVVTVLGSARLSMEGLKDLRPGQLIVLDQRIDAPMTAKVDGASSFECWPGRLGSQQAVQVSRTSTN